MTGERTVLANTYFGYMALERGQYELSELTSTMHRVDEINIALQARLSGTTTATVLKIGLDPNNGSEMAKLYDYYTDIGGTSELANLQTVCLNANKAGGHYTYNKKPYEMKHDSHGATGANSTQSVTAWKIIVEGMPQVVGIGYHDPQNGYQTIFPFATDNKQRKRGAQIDIVDGRV